MCGIAGIVANHGGQEEIARMTSSLAHRGPDGAGAFHAPGVRLGHRRLAILDLSLAGAQPMHSRDGRFTIALNGEIFNYLELRAAACPVPSVPPPIPKFCWKPARPGASSARSPAPTACSPSRCGTPASAS